MPKVKKSTLAEVVEAEKVPEAESMEEEEEDVEEGEGEEEEEEEEMEEDEEEMEEEEEEEEEEMEEEEEEEEVEEVVKPPTRSKKTLKNSKAAAAIVPTPRTTRQQKAVSIKKTVSPRSAPVKRKVNPKPSTSADAVAAALANHKRKKTDEPITLDIADKKLEEMIVPEFSCHIGNKWYVRTSKYYGRDYICIRQYNDDGSSGPGLKGANIDIDLFPKVLEGFMLFDKTMKRTQ